MFTTYQNKALSGAPANKDWRGDSCIVAASGPSLTQDVVLLVREAHRLGWRLLVVNDAYRAFLDADALYACDWNWWKVHDGAMDFAGLKFTSHSNSPNYCDDKSQLGVERYGIRLIEARDGKGFGTGCLHYGNPGSSGFQAVNLALLMGATRLALVGFDMRKVGGQSHYFGEHPDGLRRCDDAGYRDMTRAFPEDPRIVNCTPDSALTCYERVPLEITLGCSLRRDRAEPHAAAG